MCEKKTYHKTSNTQIDKCIRDFIYYLNMYLRITPIASCCGHSKYIMSVVCQVNKTLIIDLISGAIIPRTRRFYKRDKQGYYYIPEAIN